MVIDKIKEMKMKLGSRVMPRRVGKTIVDSESFVKGPTILLTEGVQNLRLDGLLTLIAITHGNLGGIMKLTRCPEQMRERVRSLDMKKSTDTWKLRHTLIQYLLQKNRFGTGED